MTKIVKENNVILVYPEVSKSNRITITVGMRNIDEPEEAETNTSYYPAEPDKLQEMKEEKIPIQNVKAKRALAKKHFGK